jgi:hypothetical protein
MWPIDVKAHSHFLLPVSLLHELRFLQNDAAGMAQQAAWAAGKPGAEYAAQKSRPSSKPDRSQRQTIRLTFIHASLPDTSGRRRWIRVVVEMNLVQTGTNEFFPQLIRLAANERHLQSRPYSNQKLRRRDQSAASSDLFLYFTRRSFPTGTRDGGRREPCEPQPCRLGERNVCRDLAAVGIPWHVQESPVRGSNEGALGSNE